MLESEERALGFFKWVVPTLPATDRWRPVIERYLDEIARRVKLFGGDPAKILASAVGAISRSPQDGGFWHGAHGIEATAKVDGIVYDHFGDFEAFILETFAGERHRFHSQEERVLRLVERAWALRILVTVTARPERPDRPVEIILHGAPPGEA